MNDKMIRNKENFFFSFLNSRIPVNHNNAGIFEGIFFWGVNLTPPLIFQEELIQY